MNNFRARLNFFGELIDKRHLAFLAETNLSGSPQFNELAVVARCEIAPSNKTYSAARRELGFC